jgi:hypothetical protein
MKIKNAIDFNTYVLQGSEYAGKRITGLRKEEHKEYFIEYIKRHKNSIDVKVIKWWLVYNFKHHPVMKRKFGRKYVKKSDYKY